MKDLDKSLQFYCEGLGLVLRHRQTQRNAYTASLLGYDDAWIDIAQLRLPDVAPPPSGHILELIAYSHPPSGLADIERNTLGSGHLAFVVDDIHEEAERLKTLGGQLVNAPVRIEEGINAGGWGVYLHDCDGVTLELVQQRGVAENVV